MTDPRTIYISGPMQGVPWFNYPAFDAAAKRLLSEGWDPLNPVDKDYGYYGKDISNPTGSIEQAERDHGFSRRRALAADLSWICETADAIAMLPGWEKSTGAFAEWAAAKAVGIEIIYLTEDYINE